MTFPHFVEILLTHVPCSGLSGVLKAISQERSLLKVLCLSRAASDALTPTKCDKMVCYGPPLTDRDPHHIHHFTRSSSLFLHIYLVQWGEGSPEDAAEAIMAMCQALSSVARDSQVRRTHFSAMLHCNTVGNDWMASSPLPCVLHRPCRSPGQTLKRRKRLLVIDVLSLRYLGIVDLI